MILYTNINHNCCARLGKDTLRIIQQYAKDHNKELKIKRTDFSAKYQGEAAKIGGKVPFLLVNDNFILEFSEITYDNIHNLY